MDCQSLSVFWKVFLYYGEIGYVLVSYIKITEEAKKQMSLILYDKTSKSNSEICICLSHDFFLFKGSASKLRIFALSLMSSKTSLE